MHVFFYHCETCGCPDIEVESWIHLNDWRITDAVDDSRYFCPACQDHFKYCASFELECPFPASRAYDLAREWSQAYHDA